MADQDPPAAAGGGSADADQGQDLQEALEGPNDGYVVPEKKTLKELVEADAGDESLERYKATLLGGAAATDAPVEVQVVALRVAHRDRPDMVLPMGSPEEREALTRRSDIVFKENEEFIASLELAVSGQIVSGLRASLFVRNRMGWRLAKLEKVLGSFAPTGDSTRVTELERGQHPGGMTGRGHYVGHLIVVDDDRSTWLDTTYPFQVRADWAD